MYDTLAQRIKAYEEIYDTEIMRRIPIIVRCDGRSFSRYCRAVRKPYEPIILESMVQAMLYVASEMTGCCFAYQQSDEVCFVLRNDQSFDSEPWYGNRIQNIVSAASGLMTLAFNKEMSQNPSLDTMGDAIFKAHVFGVPTVAEACNVLISRQQDCLKSAINSSSQSLLVHKFGKKIAQNMLIGMSAKEKIEIIKEQCGIDFNEEYPASFRLGVGAYKVPALVPSLDERQTTRKKWTIDWDLPVFTSERDFLYNIIHNGHDIFRVSSIQG